MKKKVQKRLSGIIVGVAIAVFLCIPAAAAGTETYSVEIAKTGVVELFTGITDQNGEFYRMKSASGCLVSNSDNNTYIVTAYHAVRITDAEKQQFCEQNGISTDSYGVSESIRVVVKGDVTSEVSVEAESETKDFCILSADEVMNEKSALHLADIAELSSESDVYALGFADGATTDPYAQYDSAEVVVQEGKIQDKAALRDGTEWLQHSATVSSGNLGGPLVDDEGYLIGLNNYGRADETGQKYYALPVGEIAHVLDNYGIPYESKQMDQARTEFQTVYEECYALTEQSGYTRESMAAFQSAVEEYADLTQDDNSSIEILHQASQSLQSARDGLEEKMPITQIIIYVLGGGVILLLMLLLRLIVLTKNLEQKMNAKISDGQGPQRVYEQRNENTSQGQKNCGQERNSAGREMSDPVYERLQREGAEYRSTECIYEPEKGAVCQAQRQPYLIRLRNNQRISVSNIEFVLGRHPDFADYVVTNNNTVGRRHAVIRNHGGQFWIYDLDSSNGTYVNGRKIDRNGVILRDNDEIRLSNERFYFKY